MFVFKLCRLHTYVLPHHASEVPRSPMYAWRPVQGGVEQVCLRLRADELHRADVRKT